MKVLLDLTTEEATAIFQSKLPLSRPVLEAIKNAICREQFRLADIKALTEMQSRASTVSERHKLGKIIEEKGGPKISICQCGASINEETPGWVIGECGDCYAKGYGK